MLSLPLRALLLMTPLLLSTACVTLPDGPSTASSGNDASNEDTVGAGLREALQVGVQRTVSRTARVDGYLASELIRIGLPPEMESVASRLRQVGLGGQVDDLEVAMNRAAEQAAGEATAVFGDAIRNMRPADVYAVLNGGSDAATRYLEGQSRDTLRARYAPIVRNRMADANAYSHYRDIVSAWNQLPLVEPLTLNLEDYVTDRALDGLFTVLAEEEARIRRDPVARTSELLRNVFGNRGDT